MMRIRVGMLAAATVLVVAGCCTTLKQGLCVGGQCKAEVAVKDCEGGDIMVRPDPIRVREPSTIEWTLTDEAYSFTRAGIQISEKERAGFDFEPGLAEGGRKFIVRDKYTIRGEIKYGIQVMRKSDSKVCKIKDPVIANEF